MSKVISMEEVSSIFKDGMTLWQVALWGLVRQKRL